MLKSRCQWLLRAVVLVEKLPDPFGKDSDAAQRSQGCVSQEEGSMLPLVPLCPWKVFPSSSTLGKTYQEFSQMQTICIGANDCKVSPGFSEEQSLWEQLGTAPHHARPQLPTGTVWPSCHCACFVQLFKVEDTSRIFSG